MLQNNAELHNAMQINHSAAWVYFLIFSLLFPTKAQVLRKSVTRGKLFKSTRLSATCFFFEACIAWVQEDIVPWLKVFYV